MVGIMTVVAPTLDGAAAGYSYYLSPSFETIANNFGSIVPPAMGQAFFTLSLGFSVMIAYSSYLGRDDSLPADGGAIVVVNTLVALLAGFVIFPILFATGGAEGTGSGGSGTAFTALAGAFGNVPGGQIVGQVIGFVFFVVLLFAALSSSISLLEVPVSYVSENYGVGRPTTAVSAGVLIFLLGLPAAFGTNWLTFYNDVVFNLLLPIAVLLLAVFVGWIGNAGAMDELGRGSALGRRFKMVWLWWVRTVVPAAVLVTLYLGVKALYSGLMTGEYFPS